MGTTNSYHSTRANARCRGVETAISMWTNAPAAHVKMEPHAPIYQERLCLISQRGIRLRVTAWKGTKMVLVPTILQTMTQTTSQKLSVLYRPEGCVTSTSTSVLVILAPVQTEMVDNA